MKVSEQFQIDDYTTEFENLAENNGYWHSSHEFYDSVKDKDVSNLSCKQTVWLHTIEDGLVKEWNK